MDTIVFGDGISYSTDYVASIPTPKRLYIRLPELSMVEAMQIATSSEGMSKITFHSHVYSGCSVIAVSSENGVPKLSASYNEYSKKENG